jgi:predicted PurR-regulated permease PerM
MWVKKESARIRSIIPLFVLIAFSVSIAVPLSFQIAATVENKLLTNRVNTVLSGISEKGKSAESMENEVSGIKKIGKSIVSFLSTAKDLGNALAEDLINYIIIFFVTNILIPIVTIYALLSVTKYCAKLMLGNMSVPLPAPITPIAKNKIKP